MLTIANTEQSSIFHLFCLTNFQDYSFWKQIKNNGGKIMNLIIRKWFEANMHVFNTNPSIYYPLLSFMKQ